MKKDVRISADGSGNGSPAAASSLVTSHSSPGAGAPKKIYSDEEKKACSIEAMKNGETCEACQ